MLGQVSVSRYIGVVIAEHKRFFGKTRIKFGIQIFDSSFLPLGMEGHEAVDFDFIAWQIGVCSVWPGYKFFVIGIRAFRKRHISVCIRQNTRNEADGVIFFKKRGGRYIRDKENALDADVDACFGKRRVKPQGCDVFIGGSVAHVAVNRKTDFGQPVRKGVAAHDASFLADGFSVKLCK